MVPPMFSSSFEAMSIFRGAPTSQGLLFVNFLLYESTCSAFAPVQFCSSRQLSLTVAMLDGAEIAGRFWVPSDFCFPQLGVGPVFPGPIRSLPQMIGDPPVMMLPLVPMSVSMRVLVPTISISSCPISRSLANGFLEADVLRLTFPLLLTVPDEPTETTLIVPLSVKVLIR